MNKKCWEELISYFPWNLKRREKSESELLYDWRFTASQFVLATSSLRLTTSNSLFQLNTCGYSPYVASSLTRGWVCCLQLLLVLPSAVILMTFYCLRFETPTTWKVRSPIYIPKEQGGPVITPPTGFPFRCLLRLAGLRRRYSTPPPHGIEERSILPYHYILRICCFTDRIEKPRPIVFCCFLCIRCHRNVYKTVA
jgi:hypothetical protein